MLKATAGGGGRGIRVVASDADLKDAYERTRDEAHARSAAAWSSSSDSSPGPATSRSR